MKTKTCKLKLFKLLLLLSHRKRNEAIKEYCKIKNHEENKR